MKIAYHQPSLDTIYAQRTIFHGYEFAFRDLGHKFVPFTAGDKLAVFLDKEAPDIFISSSHFYYRKYLDYALLEKHRKRGMALFTKIDFWNSPIAQTRINEARSLKNDKEAQDLIRRGLLGDIFFHVVEQSDGRMEGFEKATGKKWHTIPLAADRRLLDSADFVEKFRSDIAFVGTYLPAKKKYFAEYVFPLEKEYDLKLYGQDWTAFDRALGWIQRGGQYFNLPVLRSLRKPKLALSDEAKIYKSSAISINVHEDYQKKFGGDCNERAFKIPLCGGFEITDNVACLSKYFIPNKEIIIAKSRDDWFEKIAYYLAFPKEREAIIAAGRERVLREHTYHKRAARILELYGGNKKI